MALLALVNQQVFVDTVTGEVKLEWTNGIPPGHPDPMNWRPDLRVELTLPGTATFTELDPTPPPVGAGPASVPEADETVLF